MSEVLEQPIQATNPDEQVLSGAPEEMSLEQKKEIYNAFTNGVGGTRNLAQDIDRLQLNDPRGQLDIERLEGDDKGQDHIIAPSLKGYYREIAEAATVGPDSTCEKIWGPITEGRLVASLSNLARGYRAVKSKGVLTEYTLPESGATGTNIGWEENKTPPLETIRKPLTLGATDMEKLLVAPQEERIVVVSEMLDPYRFRHDADSPQEDITAQENEKPQIMALVESMEPSWERDLLAVEAWKYFKHPDINATELASRSIGLISMPELEQAVDAVDSHLSEHTPDVIIGRFQQSGGEALAKVEKDLGLSDEMRAQIDTEAQAAETDMAVTINIKLPQLTRALFDSHRLLPINETKNSGGNEATFDEPRRMLESDYGIYDEAEGDILPRPIYAAVALGENEKLNGPVGARSYGDCVITLKPEVTKSRTTYTYGDSANTHFRRKTAGPIGVPRPEINHGASIMTYEEMPEAKIIFDNYDANPTRLTSKSDFDPPDRYIEAQVLGGVEVDGIESITMPRRVAYQDKFLVQRIRELYPNLGIKIVIEKEVADSNQDKMKEINEKLGVEFIVGE